MSYNKPWTRHKGSATGYDTNRGTTTIGTEAYRKQKKQ